jgi:cytochrome P450
VTAPPATFACDSDFDFGLDLRPAAALLPGEAFHREMARLRAAHRLPRVRFGSAVLPLVARYEDLDAAFRNDVELPAGPTYAASIEACQGVTFESVDGPEHNVLRALSTTGLRAKAVARATATFIPEHAHRAIDAFAPRGGADLVREFTARFPFDVFGTVVGLPLDRADAFMDWAFDLLSYPMNHEAGLAAAAALTEYTRPVLAAARCAGPREDLISRMVYAERDGRRLTDEEILSHVRALFSAGATTTHHGLGNTLFAVLSHPELLERLRAEPERIPAAVDEMLRWEPPLAVLPRLVPREAHVADEVLPAGSLVLFGIASANRDPAVYPDPDRFDLDRRPKRLLTFGFGSHQCPGAHLARAQIAVGLRALLERLPGLRLARPEHALPQGTVMRGPRALDVVFDA